MDGTKGLPCITNYELECEAYALFGDPARDHADYVFNAQYDSVREMYGDMYDYCGEQADLLDLIDATTPAIQLPKAVPQKLPEEDCPF